MKKLLFIIPVIIFNFCSISHEIKNHNATDSLESGFINPPD
jgi:hypothetical protein